MLGLAKFAAKAKAESVIRKSLLQGHFERRGASLVEDIKAAAPVRKGNLRDSVRMEPAPKKPGVLIIAGGTPATARGPNLDEALLTEYGTRRELAEPYFWSTIEAGKANLTRDIATDAKDDDD